MTDPSRYRVRLRLRLAMPLNSTDVSRVVNLAGREVAIVSEENDQKLADANWVVLKARGFASEDEASEFGTRLRLIIELAGLCCRLGVDAGGRNSPALSINEGFARSLGLITLDERLHPNVHGLAILPEDDSIRFPSVKAKATSHFDPALFEGALTELAAGRRVQLSAAAAGVRSLNLALINPQPLAQIVLAISAVEALGQNEKWTQAQKALLRDLAAQVEAGETAPLAERMEVAAALRRGLHRVGLRQGVLRVLDRLGLQHLRDEWDRVYRLRSGLFHAVAPLPEDNSAQLASDAITLCGRIILTLAASEGVTLPSVSDMNYPNAKD